MSDQDLRPHLGKGRLQLERHLSVFVNCPFDSAFQEQFDAIVFGSVCCGFVPRCAIETGSAAVSRMDRIADSMAASTYSVHDLSRCKGEGEINLARFNMPLELGMAMTERRRDGDTEDAHDWLVLVPTGHIYKQFISDLAGYDPMEYDGDIDSLVAGFMAWLATRPDAVRTPTPDAVLRALPEFMVKVAKLREDWRGRPPWPDLLMLALDCAVAEGLVPKPVEA